MINTNYQCVQRCNCNSTKCLINKGFYLNERDKINNIILHKYRCCKSCKLKYTDRCNIIENICKHRFIDNEMKTKLDTKTNKNPSLGKKSMDEQSRKKGLLFRESWNSSTKINKEDKLKPEENASIKKSGKKVKIKPKAPSEKVNLKSKEEPKEEKKETTDAKENLKDQNTKNDNKKDKDYEEDQETIYISYSLKGFIKIKSKNELEICDKYYNGSKGVCDEWQCDCSWDDKDILNEETLYNLCDDCYGPDNDYFIMNSNNEPNGCTNRCICNTL